ncbi:MAG: 8-amino-7-oxononanoate synthase [Methylacidiphilales bacterium]|nr:8-amino-7-oxononanoate synthase [Candidatus Methylacidiphilales bacterium]
MNLDSILSKELAALEKADLLRRLRPADEPGLLNFAANDYLGLSRHPALIEAARKASADHGAGAGASRLVTGTNSAVLALEEELAAWKEKEAALVFSSGYAAALGTIPALVGKGDTVILDKLAHASLIDAARLSGATLRVFPHNSVNKLAALLQKLSGRILIVTESIFSMDGDAAPLREIVELKDKHGAWLFVDEAHATGLYGPTGAGLIADAGLSARVEIVMGTLSKALGSVGGYLAGSRTAIDWFINRARSFIYSTALPPGVIAAGRAAVELTRSPEGDQLRARLRHNIAHFHAGLPITWKNKTLSSSAIQPLICGESSAALQMAADLRRRGFLIPAIRYPTVPRHAARLRVTLSTAHYESDINALNRALAAH